MRLLPSLSLFAIAVAGCTVSGLDDLSSEWDQSASAAGSSSAGSAGDGGSSQGVGGESASSGAGGASASGHAGASGSSGNAGAGGVAGAAGASGKGGMSGGSGQSGAAGMSGGGGSAGASICSAMGMSCDGCLNCVGVQGGDCASEAAACSMSSDCNALYDCLGNCALTDSTCVMQCDEDHAAGLSAYKAITDCQNKACSTPCTTDPTCPTTLTWATNGACFMGFNCNPVTNQGCNQATQVCSYDGTGYSCFPSGGSNAKVCVSCQSQGCGAGLVCADVDLNDTLLCAKFCCDDTDCKNPDGTCYMDGLPGGGFCIKK